ncbi:ATG8-interacting protein 1-like [Ipomoea triloba]|uniref:ATG8-interacting protein 1-like n=1 Tax=Ipomoea triloba TaxID=35885 RepID=UPI00125D6142|nr:ATG8-interacting protein 1-like [Ipomoea triloba]XP_031113308.1 ATG8-interacting protein 1-like [Ipomoea triloba]
MASNEEVEETAPRGNEWEVVSLTASAYAAAPGKQSDLNDEHKSSAEYEAETSGAMFMSGHFVFPPSQHENLPLEPENNQIQTEQVVKNEKFVTEGDSTAGMKFEENMSVKGFGSLAFPGIQIFDENGNILPISDAEFKEDTAAKESVLHSTAMLSSLHSEEHTAGSTIVEESSASNCPLEPFQQGSDSGVSDKNKRDDNLPCQAWWKRQAASLVAHAKEANTFWSIFVAAAVMGLVILGQRWQQERWQILQLKWQHGLHDERIGRMLGPLSRLKDIIVGGDRRGSFLKGSSTSSQH